jgi:hypothetical protein
MMRDDTPPPRRHVRERVEVEPARVRSGRLGGVLHNLLTRARLTRVLTHCTWEKTTVAISKCGSKVGRYASSVCMPFLSCMVTVRGGE